MHANGRMHALCEPLVRARERHVAHGVDRRRLRAAEGSQIICVGHRHLSDLQWRVSIPRPLGEQGCRVQGTGCRGDPRTSGVRQGCRAQGRVETDQPDVPGSRPRQRTVRLGKMARTASRAASRESPWGSSHAYPSREAGGLPARRTRLEGVAVFGCDVGAASRASVAARLHARPSG